MANYRLRVGVPGLPSWVPAAGEVAVLSTSNGKLSNTFGSVVSPLFASFWSAKIVNDYSGGVLNPYWATYGMRLFFGGGHAATNDNSVIGLEIGDVCTFKRLTTPTDLGQADGSFNSVLTDPTIDTKIGSEPHAEYFDGQPVSPHSYGTMSVLSPADGGAADGTLIIAAHGAGTVCGFFSAEAAHKVDFANSSGATGSYAWARVTNNSGRYVSHTESDSTFAAPIWECHVPSQGRIYVEANYLAVPRWFDLATNTYVNGTGAARRGSDGGVAGHVMLHVPERNLMLFLHRSGGVLRIDYIDTTQGDPSWQAPGALDTSLTIAASWCCACWCPDSSRLIIGNVGSDTGGVYEIEIPTTLSSSWPVTYAAFGAGQTITWGPQRTFGKWSYNANTKCIEYFPTAASSGTNDTVYAYRPRGT